jgi:hypothetical protein
MRLSYALSLAGVLAPVMCDVPSTTIGIAELISVHFRISIAAEIPVT